MRWTLPLVAALCACGDDGAAKTDASVDTSSDAADAMPDAADPNMPATLADTGLCLDAACTQISPDVYAYQPQFQLWSDGATKRRWIYLPPGSQIDTSDMDFWQFPVGTKVWKEFTRDGIRVETRLIMRIADAGTATDWFYVPYVWNATQDATTAEPSGVTNANGTQHDVPSRFQCKTCHENLKPSRILGFSAIQLDWNNPDDAQLDLQKLIDLNLITTAPNGSSPYFPLPQSNGDEPAAIGYLHANCGHCHNPSSGVYNNTHMELRLTVGSLNSLTTTPVYQTAVNQAGSTIGGRTTIVVPQSPDTSIMIYRFESSNTAEHMPALGSEVMDPTGDTTLRTWITNM